MYEKPRARLANPPSTAGALLVAGLCVLALALTWVVAALVPATHVKDAVALYDFTLLGGPHLDDLANALLQTPGRLGEATVEYQKTLRLKPDDAQAHNGLGVALAQTPGRLPEAIAHFQAALRLQPDYAEARNNLARACPRCAAAMHRMPN